MSESDLFMGSVKRNYNYIKTCLNVYTGTIFVLFKYRIEQV